MTGLSDSNWCSRPEERPGDLCKCGHTRQHHPYVGRHATWPTRCYWCDCLGFVLADSNWCKSVWGRCWGARPA